jgi:hypothetical protein
MILQKSARSNFGFSSGQTNAIAVFASLRGYQIGWLPRDLVAGLMLAAIRTAGDCAVGRDAARNRSLCICCRITCFRCLQGEPLYVGCSRLHDCANLCRALASLAFARSPHYAELARIIPGAMAVATAKHVAQGRRDARHTGSRVARQTGFRCLAARPATSNAIWTDVHLKRNSGGRHQ